MRWGSMFPTFVLNIYFHYWHQVKLKLWMLKVLQNCEGFTKYPNAREGKKSVDISETGC